MALEAITMYGPDQLVVAIVAAPAALRRGPNQIPVRRCHLRASGRPLNERVSAHGPCGEWQMRIPSARV